MGQVDSTNYKAHVESQIKKHKILMYCTTGCTFCKKAKKVFDMIGTVPFVIYLDKHADGEELSEALIKITGKDSFPYIFIGGSYVGGYSELSSGIQSGEIKEKFDTANVRYQQLSLNL